MLDDDKDARAGLLHEIAAVATPMLHRSWLSTDADGVGVGGWLGLADLLASPSLLAEAIDDFGRRFEAPTPTVAASLFARSVTTSIVWIAMSSWGRLRRGLDVSTPRVALRVEGAGAVVMAVRTEADVAVLPDDPVTGLAGVHVCGSDDDLRSWVLARSLDEAVAPTIAATRQVVRMGSRHLWGNVAVTIANLFTTISHDVGERADADRGAALGHRSELMPTIELATITDSAGDPLVFAHRLTCCLLVKVPSGHLCSTCSLRPREERLALTGTWYRSERASRR